MYIDSILIPFTDRADIAVKFLNNQLDIDRFSTKISLKNITKISYRLMDWFYNTEAISLPIPKHNRTIRKSGKILTVEVTIEEEDRLLTYIIVYTYQLPHVTSIKSNISPFDIACVV